MRCEDLNTRLRGERRVVVRYSIFFKWVVICV